MSLVSLVTLVFFCVNSLGFCLFKAMALQIEFYMFSDLETFVSLSCLVAQARITNAA